MITGSSTFRGLIFSLIAIYPATTFAAADFQVKLIASGLDQPTYVTQAPGDPSNIIYFIEHTTSSIQGYSTINEMGKVVRYNITTGQQTTVLDLSNREVYNDDGLQSIAFSPDFNTPGAPGFGKMYVSSSSYPGTGSIGPVNGQNPANGAVALDRVEEFNINTAAPSSATTTFSRTILQYTNNTFNNHTIDWIGFDPTATGEDRNDLYINTGNASFTNPYGSGISPGGMPSQNPADDKGKVLRVDVNPNLPDAYPSDPNKNFAIPASNPIPVYNAAHPGSPIIGLVNNGNNVAVAGPALGEIYATGLRNTYRTSFDRATGDMYLGDVGENSAEEIDFLKAAGDTSFTDSTGQYPTASLGEIFELVPVPEPTTFAILIPATLLALRRRK